MKKQKFYILILTVIMLIIIINFVPLEWKPQINPIPSCFTPFSNKNKKAILKVISVDMIKKQYQIEIKPSASAEKNDPDIIRGMMTEEEILEMPMTPCPEE